MDIWLYSQQPYNSGIACMEQMCVCLDPFSAMFVSIVVNQLLAGVIVKQTVFNKDDNWALLIFWKLCWPALNKSEQSGTSKSNHCNTLS